MWPGRLRRCAAPGCAWPAAPTFSRSARERAPRGRGGRGMSKDGTVQISKFLSLALRHQPEKIGITLDPAGWVEIATLLEALAKHGKALTEADLRQVVETSDKRRFALSDDGRRIRASQ